MGVLAKRKVEENLTTEVTEDTEHGLQKHFSVLSVSSVVKTANMRQKALSLTEAIAFVAHQRSLNRRVVFTNGVFDLLHPGHIRYLRDARAEGDVLIVGLNSDRSVRAIKGTTRPINPEHERAEVLAALACVDAVVVFDEDDPARIISRLLPDVLAKGADWALDAIIGRDTVEARGGKVVRIRLAEGFSTSAIIGKIRSADDDLP